MIPRQNDGASPDWLPSFYSAKNTDDFSKKKDTCSSWTTLNWLPSSYSAKNTDDFSKKKDTCSSGHTSSPGCVSNAEYPFKVPII